MKIAVIGTGYVGLVSGVCFAEIGHDVTCVDKDPAKIDSLRQGRSPIYEDGMNEMLASNIATGRLSFTQCIQDAVRNADAVFIGVGTPTRRGHGSADLSYVYAAAAEVAHALTGHAVVVTKSTVPVGTNRKVEQLIRDIRPDLAFDVASNPEFLSEGVAIRDFMAPDRIVVGAETRTARSVMQALYAPLTDQGYPIVFTDLNSAELTKYASNAFLATKVAFVNEMAALCEQTGADIGEIAKGMGLDARIGDRFLQAGPGFGGSCFPKDTRALARTGQDYARPCRIVETVIQSNEDTKQRMVDKILMLLDDDVIGKKIAVFGATFKPDTDDMRDAPSLTVVPALAGRGAEITMVDPCGRAEGEALLPRADWCTDPYEAAQGADLIVVLKEWDIFRSLDLGKLAGCMKQAKMADLRNIYDAEASISAGFEVYASVGRQDQFNTAPNVTCFAKPASKRVPVKATPALRTVA